MLLVSLAAEDSVSADIALVKRSVETALKRLSRPYVLDEIGLPKIESCQEGSHLRVECFVDEAFDALFARVAMEQKVLHEETDRRVEIAIVNRRLWAASGELFGATVWKYSELFQFTLLSLPWLEGQAVDIRERLTTRLAQHELGHALGLIAPTRTMNVVEKYGLHCTNLCVMRQGENVQEFDVLAQEEDEAGALFCAECEASIKETA